MEIEFNRSFSFEDGVNITDSVPRWKEEILAHLKKDIGDICIISSGRGFVCGRIVRPQAEPPYIKLYIVTNGYISETYDIVTNQTHNDGTLIVKET